MVTVDFSGIPEGAKLAAMVTSNPEAGRDEQGEVVPLDMSDPYATAGAVKGWIRHGDVGWHRTTPSRPSARPAPTSVTLGLTLTAIPPDADEDMLFPLARSSIMAESRLHRYAGWGR